jgi:hypothetical protein
MREVVMTEHTMTPDAATALRKPFPPESVGKLPKGGVMLDYVGHAAVTDRLLTVDPDWTWDFALYRADGTPVLDDGQGNLWITLTVCGVTRKGVGDGKNAKERIGDALRNAAMRFGVALDLWAKENLVEFAQAAQSHRADPPPLPPDANVVYLDTSSKLAKAMFAGIRDAGIDDPKAFMSEVVGRTVTSSKELTEDEARRVLDHLPAKTGADA